MSGYYTKEADFLKRVEEDAISFKPNGQLIYSYTRPSTKGKEKGLDNFDNIDSESEDATVFEVYHVRLPLYLVLVLIFIRQHGILRVSENITDECNYSSSYISKVAHI